MNKVKSKVASGCHGKIQVAYFTFSCHCFSYNTVAEFLGHNLYIITSCDVHQCLSASFFICCSLHLQWFLYYNVYSSHKLSCNFLILCHHKEPSSMHVIYSIWSIFTRWPRLQYENCFFSLQQNAEEPSENISDTISHMLNIAHYCSFLWRFCSVYWRLNGGGVICILESWSVGKNISETMYRMKNATHYCLSSFFWRFFSILL